MEEDSAHSEPTAAEVTPNNHVTPNNDVTPNNGVTPTNDVTAEAIIDRVIDTSAIRLDITEGEAF